MKCRWLGEQNASGTYECKSPKIVASKGVSLQFCEKSCHCRDHEGEVPNTGESVQLLQLVPPKKIPLKLRDDCIHLGAIIEYCPSCTSGSRHVRECDIHEKCTLVNINGQAMSCDRCTDYATEITVKAQPKPKENKPVRVCLITPTMLMGGAERWMISLARFCDPRRIQWAGVALCWGQADSWMVEEMAEFMPVVSAPGPGRKNLPSPAKPAKSNVEAVQMVAKDADIILAWGVHDLGKLLGDSAKGKPIVFVSHGSGEWTAKAAASNEDIVTHWAGVSEASILPLKRELKKSAKIIHNGIDVLRCEPTIGRAEQRSRWGVSGREILVGYVGRYSPEKNPEAVAKAVKHLGEPYRGVYVGSGWQEKETREKVAQIAGSRCVFVEPDRQIGNVMNALDVLVLASHTEAFSLTLTEAWYCGVPTVATRVGAVPELEIDAGKRLVVPVSINPDAKELADAVQKAIDMPIEQRRLAQLIAAKHSSWRMGHDWTEYLSSLIG